MRRGHTLVEGILAVGLGLSFLGLGIEVLRSFGGRAAKAGDEAARAQELGLFFERLRRVLKLAAQVEPVEGGFVVYRAQWGGAGVALDRVLVVRAVGDEVLVREEGPVQGSRPTPEAEHRYRLGEAAGAGLAVREVDRAVTVSAGGLELWVRPAQATDGPLVLPPGTKVDLEALHARLADEGWEHAEPLAGIGPAGATPSGVTRGFPAREGTVPGPSGPVRSSLLTELSSLGSELSPRGAAFLPIASPAQPDRIDAYEAARTLMEKGWSASDASLVSVYLAAMELPHRFVRAAALAQLEGRLAGLDGAAKVELIAELHPPLVARADPEGLEGAAGPAWVAPGSLVQGSAPAEGGRGRDLPEGFVSVEDPARAGRPPDWDDWETALSGLPPELAAGLRRPGSGAGTGADPAPDPEVGVPVTIFPPPTPGAVAGSQPVARTPALGNAAEDFDRAKGTLDSREATLQDRQMAYQQAAAEVDRIEGSLARAEDLLQEREARLEARNRAQDDGVCSCPETRALIEESKAEIEDLERALGGARRTLTSRQAERDRAQDAVTKAERELEAARAVFEAEAGALEGT